MMFVIKKREKREQKGVHEKVDICKILSIVRIDMYINILMVETQETKRQPKTN